MDRVKSLIMAIASLLIVGCNSTKCDLVSPDGRTALHFTLTDAGEAAYSLTFDGEELVPLSLVMVNIVPFQLCVIPAII